MPNLLLFAACEKVVIDQLRSVISLLSLLQNINVEMPAGSGPPSKVIAMQWNTVSIFEMAPEDAGKTFEQHVALINDAGASVLQTPVALFEHKDGQHRIINQINGMPIGIAGSLTLKCYFREKDAAKWN